MTLTHPTLPVALAQQVSACYGAVADMSTVDICVEWQAEPAVAGLFRHPSGCPLLEERTDTFFQVLRLQKPGMGIMTALPTP